MGYANALGMADAVNDGGLDLRVAISWHLSSNHFPPVHRVFVPTCIEAIEHARDDDWDYVIEMPNGLSKTAGEIVEGLHLEAFLVEFTDEDDEDGTVL